MEDKTIAKEYADFIDAKIESLQGTGEVPNRYSFTHNGRHIVMVLPRSVMAQKRMLFLRNKMVTEGTFEAESEFIRAIVDNTQVDGRQLTVEDFTAAELEVLKLAYTDGLIIPLFLGGDQAVRSYMEMVTGKKAE